MIECNSAPQRTLIVKASMQIRNHHIPLGLKPDACIRIQLRILYTYVAMYVNSVYCTTRNRKCLNLSLHRIKYVGIHIQTKQILRHCVYRMAWRNLNTFIIVQVYYCSE